jgi:hypothetical protein
VIEGTLRSEPPTVAVDESVDLRRLRELQRAGRITLVQARTLEQNWQRNDVAQQGKVFRLNESVLDGPDSLAGDNLSAVISRARR